MIRLLFIISFMLFTLSCHNRDDKRNRIFNLSKDELIKKIAEENIVAGSAVGHGAIEPDQWIRFETLTSKTNEQDLVNLTNHINNTIKCYAFTALIQKKSKNIFPIVLKNISDTSKVQTFYGCILNTLTVGDFFIDGVYSGELINEKQKQFLDSIIVFGENKKLASRPEILKTISPNSNYYLLVKERLKEDTNYIIPLSKFRNPADRETILNLLKSSDQTIQQWGLLAVINYPDKKFFPRLFEIAKENYRTSVEGNSLYLNTLYKALVQYKNQPSKKVLKETIQNATGMDSIRKIDLVYDALKNYPDSFYKNLIEYF